MFTGRTKQVVRNRIGITLLVLAIPAAGASGATAQPTWQPDCVDLAAMHLEYLLLDEVVAGKGPTGDLDIDLAAAELNYLLLPEVAIDGNCGNLSTMD